MPPRYRGGTHFFRARSLDECMFADSEYLFRHAVLRDAAYQLQPPAERATLHLAALRALPATLPATALDAAAAELAHHARCATEAPGADVQDLHRQELAWLKRAAGSARQNFRQSEAAALLDQIASHPLTTAAERAEVLVLAARIGIRTWPAPVVSARLDLALAGATELGLTNLEATGLACRATLQDLAGKPGDAEATYRRALELYREAGNQSGERTVLNQLATLLRDTRRRSEAAELFEQLLAVGAGDAVHATAITNYAGMLAETGSVERAEQMYRQALKIFRAGKWRQSEGSVLGNIANLMQNSGRLSEAEPLYLQAIEVHRESGNRRSIGICLGNLAHLYHSAGGRAREAESLYRQAYQIHREMGNRRNQAVVAGNLGKLLVELRQPGEAAELLHEAERIHRGAGNSRLRGFVLGLMAVIELTKGDESKARDALAESLGLLTAAGDTQWVQEVETRWRKTCKEVGVEP